MRSLFRALLPLLGLTLTVIACGARSEIMDPDVEAASGGGGGEAPAGERMCLPNCTIGHECCVGGCGGPAAVTENDCCACLDGEIESSTCPGAVCGGGECIVSGEACEDHSECCSGYCDYPSADAEKKSCLLI
jgi:hypothetical protein